MELEGISGSEALGIHLKTFALDDAVTRNMLSVCHTPGFFSDITFSEMPPPPVALSLSWLSSLLWHLLLLLVSHLSPPTRI